MKQSKNVYLLINKVSQLIISGNKEKEKLLDYHEACVEKS